MIQRSIYDRVAGWQIIAVNLNNDILLNIRAGLHRGGKQLASTNVGCSEWHFAPRTCGMCGKDSTSPPQCPLHNPSILNAQDVIMAAAIVQPTGCLLYTSDAADDA
mgnify:CR=1 FL=1